MTPEEYQRLKDAEKKHLQEIRKLKKAARMVQRQKSVLSALEQLNTSTQNLLSEGDEALEKLTMETIHGEAKLEVALEHAPEAVARQASEAEADAVVQKMRAQNLVRQIKLQMGMAQEPSASEAPARETTRQAPRREAAAPRAEETGNPTQDGLPEKTLGRMKPSGDRPT